MTPDNSPTPPRVADRGWLRLTLISAAGVALSFAAFGLLRHTDRTRVDDAVAYASTEVTREVDKRIEHQIATVAQIRALYDASDSVERAEFDAFTATTLHQHADVHWLAWVPSVDRGGVARLVAEARADGLADFAVRDLLVADASDRATRARHYPITYVVPPRYESALGLDLSASRTWAEALAAAAEGERIAVFELPPLHREVEAQILLTIVAPVRPHGLRTPGSSEDQTPSGFIVAQADSGGLIPTTLGDELRVEVRDARGQLVARRPAEAITVDETRTRHVALSVGPSDWHVIVTPSTRFVGEQTGSVAEFALALGLLVTLFITLYVRSLERATRRATRTAMELLASKQALERETQERESLEERVRHAQKMEAMGTLAGGIAHDFNNILSAILGYTELAAAEAPPDTELEEYLGEVAKAGHRAADLVAQILAFSRQSARERRPMELHTIVREALKLLRGSIPPHIEIRDDVDRSAPRVLADATEIHQIVMNLCTNAYNAMRESGGTLVVSLRRTTLGPDEAALDPRVSPGEYVRLSVSDTGHGMSVETMRRIFEPYFTTGEPGRGTGLGLATVHGIVDALGGVVHVYSELDQGSTFNVFLPALAAEDDVRAHQPVSPADLRGHERVLLVDDEAAIVAFAATALERLGYRVTTETHSPDALALLTRDAERFDVVITDQMMPQLRGTELARRIKELRPDLPVILCSGFGDVLDQEQRAERVFATCVTKPVIAADLALAIRRVLPRPAAAAAKDQAGAERRPATV
ncbi:MAG: response regulator [Deltaproteobacteria bacterium]|nr:MAG: response regulator [Deltaproteobacteria bacterium]